MARPATLADIAKRAGVDSSTVSRFLNNPSIVAPATQQRIKAVIDEVGYVPNSLAGALASKRNRLVEILIPQISNTIFGTMIDAMVDELSAAGFSALVGFTGVDSSRLEEGVRGAVSRRVDAIISSGVVGISDEVALILKKSGTTFIQIWELPDSPVDVAIGFSHTAVGEETARFIASRGYQRPHLVTVSSPRALLRTEGFQREWAKLGGAAPTESSIPVPSNYGHARKVFAEVRRLAAMPDVVVCGSDVLAQGIIVEAQAARRQVPDDLAVMGFGNAAIAGEMRPTITTIDVDGARIAKQVAEVLGEDRQEVSDAKRRFDVGFRIIARESA